MNAKPFETVEEALFWAVEFSRRRYSPRTCGIFHFGLNRPCEIVDVFNAFRLAYDLRMISRLQYTLFQYAKEYGDLPPAPELYSLWDNMMSAVEPLLERKGIITKTD
jgi:hypothetical protein